MFKKKFCNNCKEKISGKNNFCPSCGTPLNGSGKEDYGMLGKNDLANENRFEKSIFGGLGGGMMNKMINSAMKMLEKEMQKNMNQNNLNQNPNGNFELYINGKKISPEKIKVTRAPSNIQNQNVPKNKNQNVKQVNHIPTFNSESKKKFLELSKKEPETNLRRLSDKLIYEIEIPGVKSIEEISIVRLENSIEIKAISKDKAYEKIIPINMPLSKYIFSSGKLVLELKAE